MFERFTDNARRVVFLAGTKAAERDDLVRPVYLLHALTVADGVAARALAALGVDCDSVERGLDRIAPQANPLGAGSSSEDAEALAAIGIDLDEIRRRVADSFGPDALQQRVPASPKGLLSRPRMTLTRESKQSLSLAVKQARALHHDYLGTEHLLLGLLEVAERNPRGEFTPAALRDLGIDPGQARQQVLDELGRTPA
jgi:hypothetical protein